MDTKRILQYLRDIAANNNREWFHANKAEYDAVRKSFNDGIAKAIRRISEFDESIEILSGEYFKEEELEILGPCKATFSRILNSIEKHFGM